MNFYRIDDGYEFKTINLKTTIKTMEDFFNIKTFLAESEVDYLTNLLKEEKEFLSEEEFSKIFESEAKILLKSKGISFMVKDLNELKAI